jgi:GT2 family glycosyltransferase
MTTVSIITPWLNARELIPLFQQSTAEADEIVIIDNGSDWHMARKLEEMCAAHKRGLYLRNQTNLGFATANNQGLKAATGEIIAFMNNDVACEPGFIGKLTRDVQPGGLYGPSLMSKHGQKYLEGWLIAGRRDVWDALNGWDDEYYTGLYWEDNDLCFRAVKAGFALIQAAWPVRHYGNYTTRLMLGQATRYAAENEQKFIARVQQWPS